MIITLTGSNHFALKRRLDELVKKFVQEHGDLALERLDGEEIEPARLREAVESLPFLASKKLVVVRSLSANKTTAEQIETLLEAVTDSTDLIIYEPKLDRRSTYYKTLKKDTTFEDFTEMDENALALWLHEQATAEAAQLSLNDARYLVERVGANQQLLSNELAKLISYDPAVSRQTIDLLTEPTPHSTIFELLEAAFNGNAKRALELYDEQRRMRVEPQQIIAMLVWQLHVLAVIKTAGERPADTIAKEAKLSPYVVRKSQAIARRMTFAELKALIKKVQQLDTAFKSQAIDTDDALKQLILSLKS